MSYAYATGAAFTGSRERFSIEPEHYQGLIRNFETMEEITDEAG